MSTESDNEFTEDLGEVIEQPEVRSGQPYELLARDRRRDVVRLLIVGVLLASFAFTIGFVLFGAYFGTTENWNNIKEAIQIILPVEASLLGSALSFYFLTSDRSGGGSD